MLKQACCDKTWYENLAKQTVLSYLKAQLFYWFVKSMPAVTHFTNKD